MQIRLSRYYVHVTQFKTLHDPHPSGGGLSRVPGPLPHPRQAGRALRAHDDRQATVPELFPGTVLVTLPPCCTSPSPAKEGAPRGQGAAGQDERSGDFPHQQTGQPAQLPASQLSPPVICDPPLLQVGSSGEYSHVQQYSGGQEVVGTLSRDEWEALTVYTVFAFKKIR